MATKQAKRERELEITTLLNKAAIPLARSQKLVDSWLAVTDEEKAAAASETGEDTGRSGASDTNNWSSSLDFVPRDERAGLGAVSSGTEQRLSGSKGSVSAEIDKLRRQMLGRKAAERLAAPVHPRKDGRPGSKADANGLKRGPAAGRSNLNNEDSEEEELGKASLIRSKRAKPEDQFSRNNVLSDRSHYPDMSAGIEQEKTLKGVRDDVVDDERAADHSGSDRKPGKGARSRPKTYLDEVLAERAGKKRKKKKQ